MVLLMLAGIMIGVASLAQKKVQTQLTRAQMATLQAGLESYKADYGTYPVTTPIHFSNLGGAESTNNEILYRALFGQGGKRVPRFPANQIRVNAGTGLTNVFDIFGTLFIYYNSPGTAFALSNNSYVYPGGPIDVHTGTAYGGQINPLSYDLLSCGPDRMTFVSANCAIGSWNDGPWIMPGVKNKASTIDDITSWKR